MGLYVEAQSRRFVIIAIASFQQHLKPQYNSTSQSCIYQYNSTSQRPGFSGRARVRAGFGLHL